MVEMCMSTIVCNSSMYNTYIYYPSVCIADDRAAFKDKFTCHPL